MKGTKGFCELLDYTEEIVSESVDNEGKVYKGAVVTSYTSG